MVNYGQLFFEIHVRFVYSVLSILADRNRQKFPRGISNRYAGLETNIELKRFITGQQRSESTQRKCRPLSKYLWI